MGRRGLFEREISILHSFVRPLPSTPVCPIFRGARSASLPALSLAVESDGRRTFRLLLLYLEGERAIELHNGVKTRFSTSTRLHSTFAAIDGPGGRMRQAFPSFVTRLFGRAEVNLAARLNAEIRRC